MGVTVTNSTMAGGFTPICNSCGVTLCWDISLEEYNERPDFWEAWLCKECIEYYKNQQDVHDVFI